MTRPLAVAACVCGVLFIAAGSARAQDSLTLAGTWQGTFTVGPRSERVGLIVTTSGGALAATLVAIDQDGGTIAVQTVSVSGRALHLDIPAIKGTYDGVLEADGQQMSGTLTVGMAVALNFRRVDRLDPIPTFDDADRTAVRDLIDRYFQAFTARDWDGFRAVVQVPFILWSVGAVPNALTSLDEVVARSRGTRESLEGTGYALSRAARTIITPLSATTALVDIHWRRDKADGSVFGEGAEILTVVKSASGWRITGNMTRQLSQYGKTSLSSTN